MTDFTLYKFNLKFTLAFVRFTLTWTNWIQELSCAMLLEARPPNTTGNIHSRKLIDRFYFENNYEAMERCEAWSSMRSMWHGTRRWFFRCSQWKCSICVQKRNEPSVSGLFFPFWAPSCFCSGISYYQVVQSISLCEVEKPPQKTEHVFGPFFLRNFWSLENVTTMTPLQLTSDSRFVEKHRTLLER